MEQSRTTVNASAKVRTRLQQVFALILVWAWVKTTKDTYNLGEPNQLNLLAGEEVELIWLS